MILEKARQQNQQDLAKFLREREASAAENATAAAKIARLEDEIASLRNAFSEKASDAAIMKEMRRFMQAQKERGGKADNFEIHSDGEQHDGEVSLKASSPMRNQLWQTGKMSGLVYLEKALLKRLRRLLLQLRVT